ncbi:MAG TPA: hypothetical protein VLE51_02370 [Candidatus Saccharimonadales bacterium]|nr:hypothetical protein [Candidatus Saccharimonadales bacterium]
MKSLLWLLIGIGSLIGGLIPTWLGASYLSFWGFAGSTAGAIAGIYVFNKVDL